MHVRQRREPVEAVLPLLLLMRTKAVALLAFALAAVAGAPLPSLAPSVMTTTPRTAAAVAVAAGRERMPLPLVAPYLGVAALLLVPASSLAWISQLVLACRFLWARAAAVDLMLLQVCYYSPGETERGTKTMTDAAPAAAAAAAAFESAGL